MPFLNVPRYLQLAALAFISTLSFSNAAPKAAQKDSFYTEPKIYALRPADDKEREFGSIGATGLVVRIYPGVVLKVEGMVKGSPAEGKFTIGDILTGVNGDSLKGKNPFLALGRALTKAEGTDGKMAFDILSGEAKKTVTVDILVLGAYSDTWPLDCKKSKAIIKQASAYYSSIDFAVDETKKPGEDDTGHNVEGALVNLFLLSTGDDTYLPKVRAYLEYFLKNIDKIGYHTWNNGYNGVLTAEYYLRTGDKSVLPLLQYYCDAARDTQFYGVGWKHWGADINPRYVAGGLMNPAGAQNLTTLLLAKQCGVKVNEKTLNGALQYWYRFAGHGTVPYGDHRGEGGLGSNGKDGMAAAAMLIASSAKGNVEIYEEARDYLSMSMVTSYTKMITGHADNGRGDGIWRGISSSYMLKFDPDEYHRVMNEISWWYDISRRPDGSFGMISCKGFNKAKSGAGTAMAYTAPLKALQITGASKSKFANDFTLPESLWGRPADREFLSINHDKRYLELGPERPIHELLQDLGSAYSSERADIKSVPVKTVLQNVYHKRYMVRTQAAIALCKMGAFKEIEKLLEDKSPRVRRAALDGMTDYRYWFAMGKNPIATEDVSPAMVTSIRKILADPDEACYVIDGALMAMSRAPASDIVASLDLIKPYTNHEEWWLRQSAFLALSGAANNEKTMSVVLPIMVDIFVKERRPMARGSMNGFFNRFLKTHQANSPEAIMVIQALMRTAQSLAIPEGNREGEGAHFVTNAILDTLKQDSSRAIEVATVVKKRFSELEPRWMAKIVPALLEALEKQSAKDKETLRAMLMDDYRPEMIRRLNAGEDVPLDTLIALAKLKYPDIEWQPLGKEKPADRIWHFTSFDCPADEKLHPREGKRFRDVTLPPELKGWEKPGFDDNKWNSGKAPIGVGVFHQKNKKDVFLPNQSDWGKGEFIVMRSEFDLAAADFDYYRIRVLANQGFRVYVNGKPVHTYIWWNSAPVYRPIVLPQECNSLFKKGKNIIAVYANCAYPNQGPAVGQIDIRVEGLRKSEITKGVN